MASSYPFHIRPDAQHKRLKRIDLEVAGVSESMNACREDAQALSYVPFLRFMCARRLSDFQYARTLIDSSSNVITAVCT